MDFAEKVNQEPNGCGNNTTSLVALSSIIAMGLVEISTRTNDSPETFTKLIKVRLLHLEKICITNPSQGSKTIYEGVSSRSIAGSHGTTVLVKDLFHNVHPIQANIKPADIFRSPSVRPL